MLQAELLQNFGELLQNSPSQASTVCELPDAQAGFRKGRGNRDQIANICWTIKKAREFQKKIYFCFIDYAKAIEYLFPALLSTFYVFVSKVNLLKRV